MAGVPCFDVTDSLRSLCSGWYRRDHVLDSGTATHSPAAAFDFLLSPAANGALRRDYQIVVVGICSLHFGVGQRFFCWAAVTAGSSLVCLWSVVVICRNVIRPASQPI